MRGWIRVGVGVGVRFRGRERGRGRGRVREGLGGDTPCCLEITALGDPVRGLGRDIVLRLSLIMPEVRARWPLTLT